MRIVTFTRDMRPSGMKGDHRILPDDIADRLVASGEAENPRPYPPPDVAPAVPVGTLTLSRKSYLTRKRG